MRSNLFTVGILLVGMQLTFPFFSFAVDAPGGQEGFPGMTSDDQKQNSDHWNHRRRGEGFLFYPS